MSKKKNNDARKGGLTKGDSHDASSGGMDGIVEDTGQPIKVEGDELIVNKKSTRSDDKFEFEGEMKTTCEIVSDLNSKDGNGVEIDCTQIVGKDTFGEGGKVIDWSDMNDGNARNCFLSLFEDLRNSEFNISDFKVDNTRNMVVFFRSSDFDECEYPKLNKFLDKYTDESIKPDFCSVIEKIHVEGNRVYVHTKSDIFGEGGITQEYKIAWAGGGEPSLYAKGGQIGITTNDDMRGWLESTNSDDIRLGQSIWARWSPTKRKDFYQYWLDIHQDDKGTWNLESVKHHIDFLATKRYAEGGTVEMSDGSVVSDLEYLKIKFDEEIALFKETKDKTYAHLASGRVHSLWNEHVVNDPMLFGVLLEWNKQLPAKYKWDLGSEHENDTYQKFINNCVDNPYSYIPENLRQFKSVTKVRQLGFTPTNNAFSTLFKPYLSKDQLRPAMTSVNVNEDGAVATDAHRLLFVNGKPLPNQMGNICITKDCLELDQDTNTVKDAKYPSWKAIIPNLSYRDESFDVDARTIFNVLGTLIDNKLLKQESHGFVLIADGFKIAVNAKFLYDAVKSMMQLGYKEISFVFDNINDAYRKAFLITGKGEASMASSFLAPFVLLMPMAYGTVVQNIEGEDYSIYFTFSFDLNDMCVGAEGYSGKGMCLDPKVINESNLEKKLARLEAELEDLKKKQNKVKVNPDVIKGLELMLDHVSDNERQEYFELIDTLEPVYIVQQNTEVIEEKEVESPVVVEEIEQAETEDSGNGIYKVNENRKYELYFDYDKYQALPDEDKKEIKKYFLWSRAKKAWISKAKEGGYSAKSIISKHDLKFEGKDKRLSFEEEIQRKKDRAERNVEKYERKSEKAEARAEQLQSEFNRLRKDWSWLTQPVIKGHSGSEAFGRSKQRVINSYERGFEEYDKAKYYETKKQIAEDTLKDRKLFDVKYLDNKIKESETSIRKISEWVEKYQNALPEAEGETKIKYESAIEDGLERLKYNYDKLAYFKLAKENLKEKLKESGVVLFDKEKAKELAKVLKSYFKTEKGLTTSVSTSSSYISVAPRPKDGSREFPMEIVKSIGVFKYPESKKEFEEGRTSMGNISKSYVSLSPNEWYNYLKSEGFEFTIE